MTYPAVEKNLPYRSFIASALGGMNSRVKGSAGCIYLALLRNLSRYPEKQLEFRANGYQKLVEIESAYALT